MNFHLKGELIMNVKQKALLLLMMLGTFRYGYSMENETDDESSYSEESSINADTEKKVDPVNTEANTINIQLNNKIEESNLTEVDLGGDNSSQQSSEQVPVNSDNPTTDQQKTAERPKCNPSSWGTFISDFQRGTLPNLIHELQTGSFNPKELSGNTRRVSYAINDAVTRDKSEDLVQLITFLRQVNFKIPQTDADKAVKYLEEGITKNKDVFYVTTMEQVNLDNKFIDGKYNNLLKNCALPLIAFTLELQKKKTEAELYQSNVAQKLNNHFGAIRLLQDNKGASATIYTIEKLLIETKTDAPVVGLLNKSNEMLANIQNIQDLLEKK